MCLKVKVNAKPAILKRDRVVWKHVTKSLNNDGRLVTPYYASPVSFHDLLKSPLKVQDYNEFGIVREGFHSFERKRDAIIDMEDCNERGIERTRFITKCIIPTGSQIFKGEFSYYDMNMRRVYFSCIASNQIIYEKIIIPN